MVMVDDEHVPGSQTSPWTFPPSFSPLLDNSPYRSTFPRPFLPT